MIREPQATSREAISLEHLLWIRLVLFFALLVTTLAVELYLPHQYYAPLLLAGIAAGFLSDLVLRFCTQSALITRRFAMSAAVLFDVVLLTGILLVSGGAANPFSTLLLIYVVVAASLLGSTWGLLVFLICAACYGALFFLSTSSDVAHPHAADPSMSLHLSGMWFSFVVTGGLISVFVVSLTSRLRKLELALVDAQHRSERMERLGLVSALSANAAHELSTPLNTIALAAEELSNPNSGATVEDITADTALICEQVERCKEILKRLSVNGGQCVGEGVRVVNLTEISLLVRANIDTPHQERVRFLISQPEAIWEGPVEGLTQALVNLIRNAMDASSDDAPVEVREVIKDGDLLIEVRDRGTGIPPELSQRVLEPFFTTKTEGGHLGLGLFLVSQLADDLGGKFCISSSPGGGTCAALTVPTRILQTRSFSVLSGDRVRGNSR